jgi:hypothetical protein
VKEGEGKNKYMVHGIIEKLDDTMLRISEIPIHKGTTDYRSKVLEAKLGKVPIQ